MLDKRICEILGIDEQHRQIVNRIDELDDEIRKIYKNKSKYKKNPELVAEIFRERQALQALHEAYNKAK